VTILTPEEESLLGSVERGEWQRVNIRMSEHDLVRLQKTAAQEGLPYQTLISSVLHKYINGRLVEKAR
jgi:hypothetical protein